MEFPLSIEVVPHHGIMGSGGGDPEGTFSEASFCGSRNLSAIIELESSIKRIL